MEVEKKEKKNKIKEEKQIKIEAKAKYIHISSKKVRLVADVIRGMNVNEASSQLKFICKKASGPILKLLNSVIANAEHNFNLKKENLFIKEITVNQGPTLDRWMPRAFGRTAPIRKRTSHITITLDSADTNAIKINKKEDKKDTMIQLKTVKDKKDLKDISLTKKTEEKNESKVKFKNSGFKKKMFNRKSV
ncbi:MAG: 50S ribosomal protein L22 [Patescibacteria group bacterium]